MSVLRFKAMGTWWWVFSDDDAATAHAPLLVREVERRLSRFLDGSALSRLNRERALVDPMLATVTRLALEVRELTGGAFDPTLGASLAALGYDQTFDRLPSRTPRPTLPARSLDVQVEGDAVTLTGDGALDLGGIAKGWAVDQTLDALRERGAGVALVDGGGDIRGFGQRWSTGVGHRLQADASRVAVATSSTRVRRWRDEGGTLHHHILDPSTNQSSLAAIHTATVLAPTTWLADALATAVLAAPDALLPRLPELGAAAAVQGPDGLWWTTPNWSDLS